MRKIRCIDSIEVFLKNILDRKNLKYGGNENIFTFTIDNQNVGKKTFTVPVAKVADFGLSKENISGHNDAKSICGTAEYLAPEILL